MPIATRRYILATAGHVDHGKSAIVRALTGIDPDRLPEEKSRGITIDLGFAHLDLKSAEATFRLGVIDVPGHEDFVHNMVAGVGSVDVALIVVAADDGWMPQTEEHLQILEYQGVTRGVIAVNKIDLAIDRAAVLADIRDKLHGSGLADAPIVAVSAITGEGVDDVKAALIEVLRAAPEPVDIKKPRLHVDRTFTVAGAGTIVTGTLVGGVLNRGQNVLVQPGERFAKVRSVQSHNRDMPTAVPGTRVALNLPDLRLGERATVSRGDTVTVAGLGSASGAIDVELCRSKRSTGDKPLRSGSRVFVHLGTAAAPARLVLMDRKKLDAGERSIAQLRFESAMYAFIGDRFIVRDAAQRTTIAGGIVLDAATSPRRWTAPARSALLSARAASPGDVGVFVETEIRFREAVRRDALLAQSNFSASAIEAYLMSASDGAVRETPAGRSALTGILNRGDWWVDAAVWATRLDAAAAKITDALAAAPEKLGLSLVELQPLFDPPELFDAMITDLQARGFVRRGALLAPRSHRPTLPERLRVVGERVQAALANSPMQPPNRNELSPTEADAAALRFLIDTGQAVALGDELVLSSDAIDQATAIVRRHITDHGPSTASGLKTALGTTRRVIIPLLEYLDRHGVTRRAGDRRTLS